jgi:hypothetical protein
MPQLSRVGMATNYRYCVAEEGIGQLEWALNAKWRRFVKELAEKEATLDASV